MDNILELIVERFSAISQIEAITLGGSQAEGASDDKSDYDIYVYSTSPVSKKLRESFISELCTYADIDVHDLEPVDYCIFASGEQVDIIYRTIDEYVNNLNRVVKKYAASLGFTTCLWHNLLHCKILFDRSGRYGEIKNKFSVPYPDELRVNIIDRNMARLTSTVHAYEDQIIKAARRGDLVNLNIRAAGLMASYFDIIFAYNSITNPGEKKLVEYCRANCERLPENFEENISSLLQNMFAKPELIYTDLHNLIAELEKMI